MNDEPKNDKKSLSFVVRTVEFEGAGRLPAALRRAALKDGDALPSAASTTFASSSATPASRRTSTATPSAST